MKNIDEKFFLSVFKSSEFSISSELLSNRHRAKQCLFNNFILNNPILISPVHLLTKPFARPQ